MPAVLPSCFACVAVTLYYGRRRRALSMACASARTHPYWNKMRARALQEKRVRGLRRRPSTLGGRARVYVLSSRTHPDAGRRGESCDVVCPKACTTAAGPRQRAGQVGELLVGCMACNGLCLRVVDLLRLIFIWPAYELGSCFSGACLLDVSRSCVACCNTQCCVLRAR